PSGCRSRTVPPPSPTSLPRRRREPAGTPSSLVGGVPPLGYTAPAGVLPQVRSGSAGAPGRRDVGNMKAAAWHGLLVLDKPGGITSRDAVDRAQRWFPRGTRIGHTGT